MATRTKADRSAAAKKAAATRQRNRAKAGSESAAKKATSGVKSAATTVGKAAREAGGAAKDAGRSAANTGGAAARRPSVSARFAGGSSAGEQDDRDGRHVAPATSTATARRSKRMARVIPSSWRTSHDVRATSASAVTR